MKLSEFDFKLAATRTAIHPAANRDESRLMILHKKTGKIEHKQFKDIIKFFKKDDVLVLNDTKVFPAKLFATKDRTDAKVEIFLLRELGDRLWEVLVKPARKVRIGNKLILSDGLFCDVIDNTVSGGRVVRFEFDKGNFDDILDKIGHPPLPPYIERPSTPKDKERYQTVYAEKRGAVAAPIAGLHFTPQILKKLEKKGVNIYFITLHIGLGTFKPVQVEDLNRHHMDSEYFEVSPSTAVAINEAKRKSNEAERFQRNESETKRKQNNTITKQIC